MHPFSLRLIGLLVAGLSCLHVNGQDSGYEFRFQLRNLADTNVLLAYHYGDKQYILDTLQVDAKGTAVAKGDTALAEGLYMLVFPSRNNEYFEFVVNEPSISVEGDVENVIGTLQFKGSKENEVFYEDLRFLEARRRESEPLAEKMQQLEFGSEEYEKVREELEVINGRVNDWRSELMSKHPGLLYTKILRAIQEVDVPEPPKNAEGQITDSLFQYHYVRKATLDNLDWSDASLIRTPVIYTVMDRYLNMFSVRHPDSISASCDDILERARAHEEVFKYCLVWLLNEYANSNIMGMDAVYVHLALTYYDKGEATWLDEAQRFRITDRAKRMRPTLIGQIAPNITMKDANGRTRSLYASESKYTVLYFWDPDCSHCQKETPVLRRALEEVKARYDVSVYAVNTQLELDKWLQFIEKHQLGLFTNVADFDQTSDFRVKYDIAATPVLFLLDQDKRIIAKRLVSDQLGEFLDAWEGMSRGQ
jgi:peroxiredoxin